MHHTQKSVHSAQKAALAGCLLLGLGFLAACDHPPASDQQLQSDAARATETAKKQSAEALAQARVAAANAERAVDDVAAGVKQGLDNKAPGGSPRLDLNTASAAELAALPGISMAKAAQIRRHRPYTSSHDLVKSGILTENQFDEIAPKVTVE